MATIDYKEKYEQALERARQFSEKPYLEDSAGIVEYIFPELKESEDENIKSCIGMCLTDADEQRFKDFNTNLKDCLDWLKRQGEQKPDNDLPKGEDYGIDGLWHAARILEKTLGEVEGYQSDDGILEHKCAISSIKELKKMKQQNWSEEDEMRFNNIFTLLEELPLSQNWFKSLKDRVQPKQECSEEDAKIITAITQLFEDVKKENGWNCVYVNDDEIWFSDISYWLKSLKSQSQWKPSKEQIEALDFAIDCIVWEEFCIKRKVLKGLLEQLRKL